WLHRQGGACRGTGQLGRAWSLMWAAVDELDFVLGRAQRAAFRWEAQGIYGVRKPSLGCRRGGPGSDPDWLEASRETAPTGVPVRRTWALADPPTSYQQRQLGAVSSYLSAGEEVRVIGERDALQLGLPDHDFWVLDDVLVARLNYRDHVLQGAELLTDAASVNSYRKWRDLAWERSALLVVA